MPLLSDLLRALDDWYPPATAESWDAVGLSCGDPGTAVDTVLVAVDCVPDTVDEAIRAGAQLLLTHHPLFLSGVHGVPATDPKGAMAHRMIRAGVAHFAAHTNADVAEHGVSAALADVLGLREIRPLDPDPAPALDHLSVFIPGDNVDQVVDALTRAGAGSVGGYDQGTFTVEGTTTYRPLPGAKPADGEIGVLTRKAEVRLSVVLPRRLRGAALMAVRQAHPYEEVAFELTERPSLPGPTGTGRIGELPGPLSLRDFTDHVAAVLPRTAWGVRAAGAPDQVIHTVAVCGGSGASYAGLARDAGADAYLTSDLKHHSTLETVNEPAGVSARPLALVDAAHWATEFPWLDVVARQLRERFATGGSDGSGRDAGGDAGQTAVRVLVSETVTDPWTLHAR